MALETRETLLFQTNMQRHRVKGGYRGPWVCGGWSQIIPCLSPSSAVYFLYYICQVVQALWSLVSSYLRWIYSNGLLLCLLWDYTEKINKPPVSSRLTSIRYLCDHLINPTGSCPYLLTQNWPSAKYSWKSAHKQAHLAELWWVSQASVILTLLQLRSWNKCDAKSKYTAVITWESFAEAAFLVFTYILPPSHPSPVSARAWIQIWVTGTMQA